MLFRVDLIAEVAKQEASPWANEKLTASRLTLALLLP